MSLKFDGKSNWKAFYVKFSSFAEVSEWMEGEYRDQLCWCLDGKDSEYYALLVERNQDMAYKNLIIKIEKRFGFRELPETAQVQFSNAHHSPDELLEDSVDRVLSLATRAFRDLPEKHMYQQAVLRFCQGAADKEAGSYASNIRPKNIKEAIDKMWWHQHNHQAIYGCPPRREVKQVSSGSYIGGEARVCIIGANRVEEMSLKREMGEVLSAQGKDMREIKSNLAALSAQMVVMMEDVKKNRVSGYRAPSRSPSPRKGDKPGCYQEEVGSRVAEIWVSTGEVGTRLRWESVKGVKVVQEAEGISLQGPGEEEIKDQQRLDPELAWVVRWRETGEEPTEGEVIMGDPRSKYYRVNREVFVLERGILWRKGEEGKSARRVVPKKFREQVMKLCHDPSLAGHQGIERTVEKVKSMYYWRGISKDVSAYVNGCMECNQNKKATVTARHPMLYYHAGAPMERVHLDFIGPLPRTEQGNEHILMMVDQFNKWVECIPLPSQSAEETARAAVNQFFSRFGCPFQVFTDQGRNFESALFRAMCDLLHIHKSRTTPHRVARENLKLAQKRMKRVTMLK